MGMGGRGGRGCGDTAKQDRGDGDKRGPPPGPRHVRRRAHRSRHMWRPPLPKGHRAGGGVSLPHLKNNAAARTDTPKRLIPRAPARAGARDRAHHPSAGGSVFGVHRTQASGRAEPHCVPPDRVRRFRYVGQLRGAGHGACSRASASAGSWGRMHPTCVCVCVCRRDNTTSSVGEFCGLSLTLHDSQGRSGSQI